MDGVIMKRFTILIMSSLVTMQLYAGTNPSQHDQIELNKRLHKYAKHVNSDSVNTSSESEKNTVINDTTTETSKFLKYDRHADAQPAVNAH